MSDSREQFEEWYLAEQINESAFLQRAQNGDYVFRHPQALWLTWQASRRALVVELPEPHWFGEIQIYSSDEVLGAIEAAGVRVKQ